MTNKNDKAMAKIIKATYKVGCPTVAKAHEVHDYLLSLGCKSRGFDFCYGENGTTFPITFTEEQKDEIYPKIKDNIIWMEEE